MSYNENKDFSRDLRKIREKVARAAAFLVYNCEEKEYKQAKIRANKDFGTRIMPSNMEVAQQLFIISEELEGKSRLKRLVKMRKKALEIMKVLNKYNPKLIGSVWRGTANRNSDIDIVIYAAEPKKIVEKLCENEFNIERTEEVSKSTHDGTKISFHIFLQIPFFAKVEIVVRKPEEIAEIVKCEIYGDIVKGLDLDHLCRVLKEDALRSYIPKRSI